MNSYKKNKNTTSKKEDDGNIFINQSYSTESLYFTLYVIFVFSVITLIAGITTLVTSSLAYEKVNDWSNCNVKTDCKDGNNCTSVSCDQGKCKYDPIPGCCVGECTGLDVKANYEFSTICTNQLNVCNNLTFSNAMRHQDYEMYENYIIGNGRLTIKGDVLITGKLNITGDLLFSNITFQENSTLNNLFNSRITDITPNITIGLLNSSLINSTIIKTGRIINIHFESITFNNCNNNTIETSNAIIIGDLSPLNINNSTINFQFPVINNGINIPGLMKINNDGKLQWSRTDFTTGEIIDNFIGECGFQSSSINYFTL